MFGIPRICVGYFFRHFMPQEMFSWFARSVHAPNCHDIAERGE